MRFFQYVVVFAVVAQTNKLDVVWGHWLIVDSRNYSVFLNFIDFLLKPCFVFLRYRVQLLWALGH